MVDKVRNVCVWLVIWGSGTAIYLKAIERRNKERMGTTKTKERKNP